MIPVRIMLRVQAGDQVYHLARDVRHPARPIPGDRLANLPGLPGDVCVTRVTWLACPLQSGDGLYECQTATRVLPDAADVERLTAAGWARLDDLLIAARAVGYGGLASARPRSPVAADTAAYETWYAAEYDDFENGSPRIEVRFVESWLQLVQVSKAGTKVLGYGLRDQWGVWWSELLGGLNIAQEDKTRSGLAALIGALVVLREYAESETRDATLAVAGGVPNG